MQSESLLKPCGAWNKSKKLTKINTFDVNVELVNALVMAFISQRKRSGFQKPVLRKIDYDLGSEPERPSQHLKTHISVMEVASDAESV